MRNYKGDWLEAVAEKVHVEPSQVETVLNTYNVRPEPVLASPRRLHIVEIEFSGIKDGLDEGKNGPFNFHWADLKPGLWAMTTKENLAGKSSVIEIVRCLMRGRVSDRLQEDVRRWLHKARLKFMFDGTEHQVEADLCNGMVGKLIKTAWDSNSETVLARFSNEREFESVMSNFFLRAFSMDSIVTWREGGDDYPGQAFPRFHGYIR